MRFLAFHDADDVTLRGRIAQQMGPLLRNPHLAFTTARWVRRNSQGRFRARQIVPLIRRHIGSMLIRRTTRLMRWGSSMPDRYGADGDLLLRLEAAAGPAQGYAALALPLTIGGYDPGIGGAPPRDRLRRRRGLRAPARPIARREPGP